MRIVWNEKESWFEAEISPGDAWRDDMESVRSAGFKASPPEWIWRTAQLAVLNKLRKSPSKTGLTISELALEKFQFLSQQHIKKLELKKLFEQAKKEAQENLLPKWETFTDPDTGITCFVVKPIEEVFNWTYTPPAPPPYSCFVCGSFLYLFDLTDICLYCDKIQKEKLDKEA
jgi:hypothetical protein